MRALAAFLVFVGHFTHGFKGLPISHGYAPGARLFLLAVFDEGHTGVALFMALSGYLFAKLLDGKTAHYAAFYLLHFFFVFEAARLVGEHVMPMTTFPRALGWALVCFRMMMPLGYLSPLRRGAVPAAAPALRERLMRRPPLQKEKAPTGGA